MPTPYDIARCHGVRHQGVLSDQCKTCKRTDPPRHVWQTYIEGMLDFGFCVNRIAYIAEFTHWLLLHRSWSSAKWVMDFEGKKWN